MDELEEQALLAQLLSDESGRNRNLYVYTVDALIYGGVTPLSIWPESNTSVAGVIDGLVNYDTLPMDPYNEIWKGALWTEQQDILMQNSDREPVCEALSMGPCLKGRCKLYNAALGPPICREYKMAFKK